MQVLLVKRQTISDPIGHFTPPVNVSGQSLLTFSLTVYNVGGTSPSCSVQLQTSAEGETWKTIGTAITLGTTGMVLGIVKADTDAYDRLIRASVIVTGTDAAFDITVSLNTFLGS